MMSKRIQRSPVPFVGCSVGTASINLNDKQVRSLSLSGPGRYRVSPGLYLEVDEKSNRRWIARLQSNGRRHDFGLGPYPAVSLREARQKCEDYKRALSEGRDPRINSAMQRAAPLFREAAYVVWEERKRGWKNAKHVDQWITTLERYAFPTLGRFRVDQVTHALVSDVLAPIWLKKPETAMRVAQRIKTVMDWSAARQYAAPISMDVVRAGLPKARREQDHFRSMPWPDVPAFFQSLFETDKLSKLALAFLILTAARSGEVREMTWAEVDLEAGEWRIPGSRMKMGRPHVVPLSSAARDILSRVRALSPSGDLVFPNSKGKPLSDMTLTMILRRTFGEDPPTAHGFRSAFTDWAAEETNVPREVVDAALAHRTGSKVDMAYRRTDFMKRRADLMQQWADFVSRASAQPLT